MKESFGKVDSWKSLTLKLFSLRIYFTNAHLQMQQHSQTSKGRMIRIVDNLGICPSLQKSALVYNIYIYKNLRKF